MWYSGGANTGGAAIGHATSPLMAVGIAAPEAAVPEQYALAQNYPNPFNPSTTIEYALPHRANIDLIVYNTLGQQVSTLVSGDQEAGYHEVKFDASSLSSGVYFYRLKAVDFVATKRFLVVR
jgi:hypothetical protein